MKPYDFLIRRARVVDGTGAPWYLADVALKGDRIAAIGHLSPGDAGQVIEAEGRYLTPGFVDTHVHSDLMLLAEPDFPSSVYQGVTSHVIGQDGISYAPAVEWQPHLRNYFAGINGDPQLSQQWGSVAEYLAHFDDATALNVAYLLPQGAIRLEVMGLDEREPTREEITAMQRIAAQGMRDGAVGLSTGLDYIPCFYSGTQELGEVCQPVGELGGVYVSHIRSYSLQLEAAFEEALEIGRIGGLPVHISHFNGRAPRLSGLVDAARAAGSDVTFDTYPFLAGCSILSMIALPRWMEQGGIEATLERLQQPATRQQLAEYFINPPYPLESLQLTYVEHEGDRDLEGLYLPDAAQRRGKSLSDLVADLLVASQMKVAVIAHHSGRTEEDVLTLMRHPAHVGGSDGIYTGSRPHPRGFATFARYLEYVRDRQVLPLETMVTHLAAHPARRFHLKGRGVITPGFYADLNLFDIGEIKAHVCYGEVPRLAEGMGAVFVNGRPVLLNGKATGLRPGRAARGPAAQGRPEGGNGV